MALPQAFGVIGAAYGDEGKGVLTDALVHRERMLGRATLVARFNGGAQAGHTVTLPNGGRHVFHHWGAGALAGAGTFLGRRFAVHPLLWERETRALAAAGACLDLWVDPRAPVTVPTDVMINQAIEGARGGNRHGSCGVGFGETLERGEQGFGVTAGELAAMNDGEALAFLAHLADAYVPGRLAGLGLPGDALGPWVSDPAVRARFVEDCRRFLAHARLAGPDRLAQADAVVFEGAQGLALDEELGAFPYVTRSKTGLPFLVEMADEAGIPAVHVTYASRAYTTRHGAGPLPHETGVPPSDRFDDPTNLPNAYQGRLRFAPLDPEALARRIAADRARAGSRCAVSAEMSLTCLDQVDAVRVADGEAWPLEEALPRLADAVGLPPGWQSHGPSRATCRR